MSIVLKLNFGCEGAAPAQMWGQSSVWSVCGRCRSTEWPEPRCFRRAPRRAQDGARGAGGRRGRARAPGAAGAQPAQRGRGARAAGAVAAAQPLPAAPHRAQEWWVRGALGPGGTARCRQGPSSPAPTASRCCGMLLASPSRSFTRQGSSWSSSRHSGTWNGVEEIFKF